MIKKLFKLLNFKFNMFGKQGLVFFIWSLMILFLVGLGFYLFNQLNILDTSQNLVCESFNYDDINFVEYSNSIGDFYYSLLLPKYKEIISNSSNLQGIEGFEIISELNNINLLIYEPILGKKEINKYENFSDLQIEEDLNSFYGFLNPSSVISNFKKSSSEIITYNWEFSSFNNLGNKILSISKIYNCPNLKTDFIVSCSYDICYNDNNLFCEEILNSIRTNC